jgi:hypothetical protein
VTTLWGTAPAIAITLASRAAAAPGVLLVLRRAGSRAPAVAGLLRRAGALSYQRWARSSYESPIVRSKLDFARRRQSPCGAGRTTPLPEIPHEL